MGHHKAGHRHKQEEEFMVGKDNVSPIEAQPASSTIDVVEETGTEISAAQQLQARLKELRDASGDALGDLRSGLGTAAQDVRSGVGAAVTHIRASMTKAAGRFNGGWLPKKSASGKAAH